MDRQAHIRSTLCPLVEFNRAPRAAAPWPRSRLRLNATDKPRLPSVSALQPNAFEMLLDALLRKRKTLSGLAQVQWAQALPCHAAVHNSSMRAMQRAPAGCPPPVSPPGLIRFSCRLQARVTRLLGRCRCRCGACAWHRHSCYMHPHLHLAQMSHQMMGPETARQTARQTASWAVGVKKMQAKIKMLCNLTWPGTSWCLLAWLTAAPTATPPPLTLLTPPPHTPSAFPPSSEAQPQVLGDGRQGDGRRGRQAAGP
jgi:hypothetical protein